MEWFYAGPDGHVGPFSEAQMAGLVRSGAVPQDELVWKQGTDSWVPAGQEFPSRLAPPPIPNQTVDGQSMPGLVPPAPPGLAIPGDPVHPPESVRGRVGDHWASLSRSRRAATVVTAFAFLVAWLMSGAWAGNVFWLTTLVAFAGATQFNRAPRRARLAVLWGAAATGLFVVWVIYDGGAQNAIKDGTYDLEDQEGAYLLFALFVCSVALAVLVRKREGPENDGDWEVDADSPWAAWGIPDGPQASGSPGDGGPVVSTPAPRGRWEGEPEAGPPYVPVDGAVEGPGDRASTPVPSGFLGLPPPPSRMDDVNAADAGLVRPIAPADEFPDDPLEDEARRRALGTRAGIGGLVLVLVALAAWVGLAAYERSEAARERSEATRERVTAFVSAVGAVRGPDPDAALAAGAAAVVARGDGAGLAETFGPQGPTYAGRLADAYVAYLSVAEGPTAEGVARQRSVLEGAERALASAVSNRDRYERRAFTVGRQFGPSSYEAVDGAVFRRVVLLDPDGQVEPDSYARRVVLYVRDEGERAVTVTVSNAYRSYDQTEYFTHFAVKGPAAEIDRLVDENAAGLAAAREMQELLEYEQARAVAAAREAYWSRAEPDLTALQAAE